MIKIGNLPLEHEVNDILDIFFVKTIQISFDGKIRETKVVKTHWNWSKLLKTCFCVKLHYHTAIMSTFILFRFQSFFVKSKQCCQKYFPEFRAFGLKISEISAIFSQISGVFGLFFFIFFQFLPYPSVFIAFLCDNFSKI